MMSRTVMLMYAVAVPPVFVAVMVYIVRVSNSVGVPLSVPFEVSKERPLGSDGLMAHDTISPEPVMVGESGRSLETVLLVIIKSFGEYAIVGTSSTIVMLMYAVAVPPVLVAVIVYSATCQQFSRRSAEHTCRGIKGKTAWNCWTDGPRHEPHLNR